MSTDLQERCMRLLVSLRLISRGDEPAITRLTGGVASDIALADLGDRKIVLKFPLWKLRVAEDWYVPLGRSRAEYRWLEFANRVLPNSAPRVLGRDDALNGFAMEFVHGNDVYLWKTALLERGPAAGEAAKTGTALGLIHAASVRPEFEADLFQNQKDFDALRLEPYLKFTATPYPELVGQFDSLVRELRDNSSVLIHGDVSPKNILFRDQQPVFLDAECATMGDPCFDVAFCINHLVLKSFHMPDRANQLITESRNFWANYAAQVTWEDVLLLESRVCRLLPALLLARIDGRSPVEYLDDHARERVRRFAVPVLANPPSRLEEILRTVTRANRI